MVHINRLVRLHVWNLKISAIHVEYGNTEYYPVHSEKLYHEEYPGLSTINRGTILIIIFNLFQIFYS